jgi:hypothetical protein
VSPIAVLAVCLPGRLPGLSFAEDSLDTIETLELHHLKADVVAMRLLANTSRMSTSSPGQWTQLKIEVKGKIPANEPVGP